ncbi:MAG TPA: DUF4251 domain-containing protein [Chitinophagaceae bacterium]|nr:DUF4251 domain-containing protein [Chitinophagaceae bacterium]
MKTIYKNFGWILGILITASACVSTTAQDGNADFKNMIDSKRFVFVAQSVTPLGGRFQQLTTEYDLKVRPDSVIAYLPYFGRAFSAPIDPNKGGIQFTSTDFEYTQAARRKGGWDILIKPNDTDNARQLTLTVTEGGNATLQVVSNNRQSISFNGYIKERN